MSSSPKRVQCSVCVQAEVGTTVSVILTRRTIA